MKTIAQIAAELGVSKQAVYQKIKQEPLSTSLKQTMSRKGNAVIISIKGENLIRKAFLQDSLSTLSINKTTDLVESVESVESELTASLKSQIEYLNKRNEELATQNKDLQEQLDNERKLTQEHFAQLNEHAKNFAQLAQNAQQLHLGDMMPRIAGSANTQEKVQREPKEKAGIIQKIFGKKKRLDAE